MDEAVGEGEGVQRRIRLMKKRCGQGTWLAEKAKTCACRQDKGTAAKSYLPE